MDITEFLAKCVADDERGALAATFEDTRPDGNHWQWGEVGHLPAPAVRDGFLRSNGGLSSTVSLVTVETYEVGLREQYPAEALHAARKVHAEVAEHIARHDPARVLREVAAKRRVLARHHAYGGGGADHNACYGCGLGNDGEPLVKDVNDCPELRDMASVYADRPGYQEGWKV